MPHARAVRRPVPQINGAHCRLLSRADAGWAWAVGRRALWAPPGFSRADAKTRDGLRRLLAAGNRRYTEVGAQGGRPRGGGGRYVSGGLGVYAIRLPQGRRYAFPVQVKGGTDEPSAIQIEQDLALCQDKFPLLICRAIAAQFMPGNIIALFEFELDEAGEIRIRDERHYRLV